MVENLLQDKTYSRQTVRNPSNKDTNKHIGEPQFVSTKPIHVGPGTAAHNGYSRQPSSNLMTSYSDRYGWTRQDPPTLYSSHSNMTGRNWTSIELAKPVWGEEEDRWKKDNWSLHNYQAGSAERLDIDQVARLDNTETYGLWDQSLNLTPTLARWVHGRGGGTLLGKITTSILNNCMLKW